MPMNGKWLTSSEMNNAFIAIVKKFYIVELRLKQLPDKRWELTFDPDLRI